MPARKRTVGAVIAELQNGASIMVTYANGCTEYRLKPKVRTPARLALGVIPPATLRELLRLDLLQPDGDALFEGYTPTAWKLKPQPAEAVQ